MNSDKDRAPFYIRAIAWLIINGPYYALFYLLIQASKWCTSAE
jgi:hypothetical protein